MVVKHTDQYGIVISSMKSLTDELVELLKSSEPEKSEQWIELFNLFYGDLLEGEEWRSSVKSLGYQSGSEADTLFCMYTTYSLTIRAMRNCIIQHHFHGSDNFDIEDYFTDKPLEPLNVILSEDISLFDWPLSDDSNKVNSVFSDLISAIQSYDMGEMLSSIDSNGPYSKRIFQNFFPKTVRHHLGEYYTPKWLVEMTLEQGFINDQSFSERRFIDPSCGSGAFLVELIRQMSSRGGLSAPEICERVVGIDINPTAVIASQCNYLLALMLSFSADSIKAIRTRTVIPVFLGDSMLSPTSAIDSDIYSIATSEGEISYRFEDDSVVRKMNNRIDIVDGGAVSEAAAKAYVSLQHELSTIGEFTDLVGNPPWISWEHISPAYKDKMTRTFLEEYFLYEKGGIESRLGMGHDDICVAFMFICADRFLCRGGEISMLMKQSIYQGDAHGVFRQLRISKPDDSRELRLNKIIDLSSGNPFNSSGAAASIVSLSLDAGTDFPVPYVKYLMGEIKEKHGELDYSVFKASCQTDDLLLMQDQGLDESAPWLIVGSGTEVLQSGRNAYSIRHGYVNDATSVYFLDIVRKNGSNLIVEPSNCGRKRVPVIEYEIEPARLFPCLKAKHVKKWKITGNDVAIVPQDRYTDDNQKELETSNPLLYKYLLAHKELLLGRKSFHIREQPFYSTYGIGEYTFSEHKVLFNAMGTTEQTFCVGSTANSDYIGRKVLIPHNNINCISVQTEDEAYFVCGVLNSDWVRRYALARIGKSKYPWSAKMLERVPVPKFDRSDANHHKVSEMSRSIHRMAREHKGYSELEDVLDSVVSKILN